MLLILMGPSSSGKSSIAKELKERLAGDIYSGKDYMRFAKNKDEAWDLFKDELTKAAGDDNDTTIFYVITEIDDVTKLRDIEDAIFVRVMAELDTMKDRFAQRMGGKLPDPVAKMLERQAQAWEQVEASLTINTSGKSPEESTAQILQYLNNS